MQKDSVPEISLIWNEAKAYIDRGNYPKAIEIYKYILIRYGDEPVASEYANAYLADIYLTLRNLGLAEDHIKKAILYKPEKPGYRYILGFIYSIQQHWRKALKEFKLAVAHEPENGEYLRGLGWVVFMGGSKIKGIAYLNNAHELDPANVNILTDLAAAHLSLMDFDKAKEYGEKVLKLDPGSALAKDILDKIARIKKRLPDS